jgi:chitinase
MGTNGTYEPAGGRCGVGTLDCGHRVVGYFASWNVGIYGKNELQAASKHLTHLNYAFAMFNGSGFPLPGDANDCPRSSGWPGCEAKHGNSGYEILNSVKSHAGSAHVKTLLSFGGWSWGDARSCGNFTVLCNSVVGRVNFAQHAVSYARKFGFDGIDIDWEYPGDPSCLADANTEPNVTITKAQDIMNFHSLMGELRTTIDSEPVAWADRLLLSMAAPSAGQWADSLDMAALLTSIGGNLDFINVMAYDYHGGWEKIVDANAPLPEVETTITNFVDKYEIPAYKVG